MTSRRTVQDYLYDSTEHTATCCLGDVFFRKRRLTSACDYYTPSLKTKLALDDPDEDDTSCKLASSTERTLAAAGPAVNLNSKYQGGSSEDNSRGTRLAATPDNDSYSRAVSHPVSGLGGGSRPGSFQDSSDLPPRYTPTREDQPLQTAGNDVPGSARSSRNRRRPRAASAGRLAKEHEMLQNMWLESHGRRQKDQQGDAGQQRCRRSSSVGNSRTVHIIDRAARTTYRRGRLLGKVLYFPSIMCVEYF